MKGLFLALCLTVTLLTADAFGSEKALQLYRDAEQAFESGNLVDARSLAKQALEIKASDGVVHTNIRRYYKLSRVGRQIKKNEYETSDTHAYSPNRLLGKIEVVRKKKIARSQLLEKRAMPPQIVLADATVRDTDRDGTLSGYEDGTLELVLMNRGASTAEDIVVSVTTPGLVTPLANLTRSLGHLPPQEQITVRFTFRMPDDTSPDFRHFLVAVTEKDGLGGIDGTEVAVSAQRYFSPDITTRLLAGHSDEVVSGENATLRYRVTNTGAGTAWDTQLSLNFNKLEGIHLVSDLDLKAIHMLRPGEHRDISFTVQADFNQLGGLQDVMYLQHQSRAYEKTIALNPVSDMAFASETGHLARWQASRSRSRKYRAVIQNTHAALIVSGRKQVLKGQLKNSEVAEQLFTSRLGIKPALVQHITIASAAQWHQYLSVTLPAWLQKKGITRLHIYMDVQGESDNAQQMQLRYTPLYHPPFTQTLPQLYSALMKQPVTQTFLWLEAPFTRPSQGAATPVLIAGAMPAPPQGINLFAAAMPGSTTVADSLTGSGLFTALVNEGLSGAADANTDQTVTTTELNNWLQSAIPEGAFISKQHAQYPVFLGTVLPLNRLHNG